MNNHPIGITFIESALSEPALMINELPHGESQVPFHLAETPWLEFEKSAALALCRTLKQELSLLNKKAAARHVHDSRVALRRWFSVWNVMREDGWQSDKFQLRVNRKLRRLSTVLGELRDWDVNIELGKSINLPEPIIESWKRNRRDVRMKVKRRIQDLDVSKLMRQLEKYLNLRPEKIRARRPHRLESAYAHMEPYLIAQEETVKRLAADAKTLEELHQLRLSIKSWRYLLTEFFGVTNLQLVKAQQLLGKLNDFDRLGILLSVRNVSPQQLQCVVTEKDELLGEFNKLRKALPYGLRPRHISFAVQL